MALQHRERRLFECRHDSLSRVVRAQTIVNGGVIQVFEVGDEFVDGGVGQVNAGSLHVPANGVTDVDAGHGAVAGFTPATSVSAAMKRPQSSR